MITQVQTQAVRRRAERAIAERRVDPSRGLKSVTRDGRSVIVHVNSGGNALAVQPALRRAGYTVLAGWDAPDDDGLRTTYGVKLRVSAG